MVVSTIEVDGSIALTTNGKGQQPTRVDSVQRQRSRLNDVMIVLEKDRQSLEAEILSKLTAKLAPINIGSLDLTLHPTAPEFHTSISTDVIPTNLSPEQKLAIETAVATEIYNAIQRHASLATARQWHLSVSANCRSVPIQKQLQYRIQSIWFRLLFILLAAMILVSTYLAVRSEP
jgi:hypothetical protein